MMVMRRCLKSAVLTVLLALLCSGAAGAVETAPRISDREIVEDTAPSAQFQHQGQQETTVRFDDADARLDRQYRLIFWLPWALVA